MDTARWTLDEPCRRCGEALDRAGVHQHNGQVAQAPNGRAVRWYASIGLSSRPVQRGRIAFYGPRHLAQLVAIKRLQAGGLSIECVQEALCGTGDEEVKALADVPSDLLQDTVDAAEDCGASDDSPKRRPFWADGVADALAVPVFSSPPPPLAPEGPRVAWDHPAGVTVVLSIGCATGSGLDAAIARFVDDLIARGLLANTTASSVTTHIKENTA